ncbi:TPA: DUF551 domain-containing protein [Klebsiella michiganensis]|nr:DUF551 domain-containing protein [Klebsiella michiganensis]
MRLNHGDVIKSVHTGNAFVVEYVSADGHSFILQPRGKENSRSYNMHDFNRSFVRVSESDMLQAGNSPVIPDSARDALEKALAAMEFMGDTLNNLDAVCTEDVEFVAPAFDAVRNVLAAAPQLPGSEPATVPGKWIPVSEQMPETYVNVLLTDEHDDVCIGQLEFEGDIYFYVVGSTHRHKATHWMPLPAVPQEVKDVKAN